MYYEQKKLSIVLKSNLLGDKHQLTTHYAPNHLLCDQETQETQAKPKDSHIYFINKTQT